MKLLNSGASRNNARNRLPGYRCASGSQQIAVPEEIGAVVLEFEPHILTRHMLLHSHHIMDGNLGVRVYAQN